MSWSCATLMTSSLDSSIGPTPSSSWLTLRERFAQFGLALHPDKTRLIEFGRFAAPNRRSRGEGKPQTFNFLGFTHCCAKTRKGGFMILRQTMRQRLQAKLAEVKLELRRRMHLPLPEQGRYLHAVVGGHVRYYGVPSNGPSIGIFRGQVGWLWWRSLKRRSQSHHLPRRRMEKYIHRWLRPLASATRNLLCASASSPKARAGCGNAARPDPSRG